VQGPVTVYVSLPLTGPSAADGADAADGGRLALQQAGGRAADLEVRARYLDDANGSAWDPVAVGRNARRAVQDSSTAAYIGELASEPTRASAPITNDAGIVQLSPGAGGIDLTEPAEGYPDTPDRYRPSDTVTFARVVPSDAETVRAAAEWAAALKLRRVLASSNGTPFGDLMLREFSADATEVGVEVTNGATAGSAPEFLAGAASQGPGLLKVRGAVRLTSGALAPSRLPKGAFAAAFTARFGREPGPYAAYGYEAMRVVLEAIGTASGKEEFRVSVAEAVIGSQHPDSILGPYSITSEGDTTLCAIQRYQQRGGDLVPRSAVCPRD
jgi:branched-chain amino acid transport system substrate-binding protein